MIIDLILRFIERGRNSGEGWSRSRSASASVISRNLQLEQ